MNQLLVKGVRMFKFDPHYVTDSSDCKSGCLLLNHDKPVLSMSTYSSATDLINYLKSENFERLGQGEKIVVALCFKSAPDLCKNTTAFHNWIKLVDEFYEAAVAIPNVEIILDGDAKPINCLVDKWLPWKSVWIKSDGPKTAFYDNDLDNGDYRFQVLNNPTNVTDWEWMAQPNVNYGKFSSSLYPYQLWEVINN